MKWETTTLGELCRFKAGVGFSLNLQGRTEGDYPFIKVSDMNLSSNALFINDANNWVAEVDRGTLGVPLVPGTSVFAKIGEALKQNRVRLLVRETFVDNNMMGAIANDEVIESRFLFFLLQNFDIAAKATGAALPYLRVSDLESSRVIVPIKSCQKRIIEILGAYDDLLENNRRRMALLEEAARKLYREWFVRLRFPGREHTPIPNGIPEGWERKTLADLCEAIRDMASPDQVDADTPYIGLEHIPRRSISQAEWGRADEVTSSKHKFSAGDILFGKIRPYFHKVSLAFVDGVASADAIVIRPKESTLHSLVLMTVSSDAFVAMASQTAKEGSKMPRADWKQMQAHPVLRPPDPILEAFNRQIIPITQQLRNLAFQTRKLRTARDRLLPKLMSGELVV